ncbi:peroxide stress protein YaaA, partial [Streptococcus pasteurianus]
MKIIFSPAKEMSLDQPRQEDWQLNPQSQAVVQALKSLSPEEVAKILKVKDKLLETNLAYIEDFDQGKTYPAI